MNGKSLIYAWLLVGIILAIVVVILVYTNNVSAANIIIVIFGAIMVAILGFGVKGY